ncbi:MAG: lamin tail domain-containing protein, partial [Bacteroidota bacterium]
PEAVTSADGNVGSPQGEATPREAFVAITEFMNNSLGADREFVELRNYGSSSVDLIGWTLSDEDADNVTFPPYTLAPDGVILVVLSRFGESVADAKADFEREWFSGIPQDNILVVATSAFVLGNMGDEIILKDDNGNISWILAYTDDETEGRATFLTSMDYENIPNIYGTKASPGVNRDGNDLGQANFLGYESNNDTADPDAFTSADGNVGSPEGEAVEVSFTGTPDFCINAGVQTNLSGGSPAGGTYAGPGVTDNGDGTYDFDPAVAGGGPRILGYGFMGSVALDTLEIFPVDTTRIAARTCDVTKVKIDTVFLTNMFGCDSVVITNTTLFPSDTTRITSLTCDIMQVKMDTVFLTNQFGCDSVVITNTTLAPSDTTRITSLTCDIMQVKMDTVFLTNQFGCDSVVITNTTLSPSDTTRITSLTCDIMQVKMDTVFLTNQFGCDSVVITNTTLAPSDTTRLSATTCDPMEVKMDTVFLTNQFGCDSLVITNTTLLPLCVKEFILVDADADTNVVPLTEGACLLLQDLPKNFNIIAIVEGTETTDRVTLTLDGPISTVRTERKNPYAVFGDIKGDYNRRPTTAGAYKISATPFYQKPGLVAGTMLMLNFEIIDCEISGPAANAGPHLELDCSTGDAMLMGSVTGGTGAVMLSWTGPSGFSSTDLMPTVTEAGIYVLTATDSKGCTTSDEVLVELCPVDCTHEVFQFVLVVSDTDQDIMILSDGAIIDLVQVGWDLNIRAEVLCCNKTESVRLELSGAQSRTRTENKVPYALAGDSNGNYSDQNFIPGGYALTATPYPMNNAQGTMGTPLTINFTVITGAPAPQTGFGDPSLSPDFELSVFPVPTNAELFIDMKFFEEGTYQADMFDVSGRVVMSKKLVYDNVNGKSYTVNTQQLAVGVYMIRVTGQNYQEWKKISINR